MRSFYEMRVEALMRHKVTGGLIALMCALGLIGWAATFLA